MAEKHRKLGKKTHAETIKPSHDKFEFKKQKEFDFEIDRKNKNFIRLTIGEHIGFQYIVETLLPQGNNEKIIRIMCNQMKSSEMMRDWYKSKIDMEKFKETFSEIILYHLKSGRMENFSNRYVIVKDFHKIVFSTEDWLATRKDTFSKGKVETSTINEVVESHVEVKSIKKITGGMIQNGKSMAEVREHEAKDALYSFSKNFHSINDELENIFCIDSSNLEEIANNLQNLYSTGFMPDRLLMDFKIYDCCEIDVEFWHKQPMKDNDGTKKSVKKLKRIVPLAKLDKIIPIEIKTIPIKNSSFTQNQKKFMEYVHDNTDDFLKPLILHISLENIFASKVCPITEYSVT